jgi:signal transduction histidine kinase
VKFSFKLFIVIVCILLFSPAHSTEERPHEADLLKVNSHALNLQDITTEVTYCLPGDAYLTIDTIKNCEFLQREQLPAARLFNSEFWIKAVIQTTQPALSRLTINIRPHFLNEIDLYQHVQDDWKIQRGGNKYSSRQTHAILGGYSFLLNAIPENHTEIFIRIKTSGLFFTAITVEPFSFLAINKNHLQLGIGIQIGALLFVILFLTTAHLLNPKLGVGRFTLLMIIVLLCYLSGSGVLSEYLLADYPMLDDSIFLGLFLLRVVGWVWVAQGVLHTFATPWWFNTTCRTFYWTMLAGVWLSYLHFNGLAGILMLYAFVITQIVLLAAVIRTQDIPRLYKITLLIALILSNLIFALSLLLTQYPIVTPGSAIYLARGGDFVHPLILLVVILFGGKINLTELNKTKIRLQMLTREAELEHVLLNEKKILVDMLIHEVRTPLGSIRLAINSIRNYLTANDAVDLKRLNNINQSLKNIDGIIEHCSLMNQIEQGALDVQIAPVNLNQFIKQYASELDDISLNRLHFRLSDQITINSDSYILKIIFTNLIENALKYSLAESTIYVDMCVSDTADNRILIQISNQFDPKNIPDLNQVFDRYYRNFAVTNISGTGLGLHLSQELSSKIGGHLAARIRDNMIIFTLSLDSGRPA